MVPALGQPGVDPGRWTASSVVIEEPFGLGDPVGQIDQGGASRPLDHVERLTEPGHDVASAVAFDQLEETTLAQQARRALGAEIGDRRVRVANVLGQQVEQIPVLLTTAIQTDGGTITPSA